jgi:lipopolysaccharide export LptBFGC system permease protein LptF
LHPEEAFKRTQTMQPLLMIIEPVGLTPPTPKPDTGNNLEEVNSEQQQQQKIHIFKTVFNITHPLSVSLFHVAAFETV